MGKLHARSMALQKISTLIGYIKCMAWNIKTGAYWHRDG